MLTAYVKEKQRGPLPSSRPYNRRASTLLYRPPVGTYRRDASVPSLAKPESSRTSRTPLVRAF